MIEITGDVYLLGDVHGSLGDTFRTIEANDIRDSTIVCVGDLAAGYIQHGCNEDWLRKLAAKFAERNIKFYSIRGNHDDPAYFRGQTYGDHVTLLRDYTYAKVNEELWLFVGGATSVDRVDNIEGLSYWKDEEFKLQIAKVTEVDVLITHTGPNWIGPNGLNGIVKYYTEREGLTLWLDLQKEREQLDTLYRVSNPKRAYMGHFHVSETATVNGCRARILKIDELVLYNR